MLETGMPSSFACKNSDEKYGSYGEQTLKALRAAKQQECNRTARTSIFSTPTPNWSMSLHRLADTSRSLVSQAPSGTSTSARPMKEGS